MPEVSVIVPVYNVEKYLNRCVDSILAQSFTDFELILIDDGSRDKSGEICDGYAKSDNRVKVIHKKNGGVSVARNIGIDAATGKYIMFVDSDDYIAAKMLESMFEKTYENADLIISSLKMICKDTTYDFQMQDTAYSSKELIEEYCLEKYPRICLCGPCCKLYKKEVLYKYNIRFDLEMSLGEDTCFNMIYVSKIKKVVLKSDVCYMYMRDNENSLFSKYRNYYYDNLTRVHECTYNVAQGLGCSREALSALIATHVDLLLSNILKAFLTASKKECISYMKDISTDKYFLENITLLKQTKLRRVTTILLKYKKYNLIYQLMVLKYGNRKQNKGK